MSDIRLITDEQQEWPPLAWIARCRGTSITLVHGPGVEIQPTFWAEAVWDGDFAKGDLDRTDLVFGSGGRIRGDKVTFVSSGSTVDRLVYMQRPGGELLVSNSLPCLLESVDGECPVAYLHYYSDIITIKDGIDNYKREIATTAGTARLLYHRNLAWNGNSLYEIDKPHSDRVFTTFDHYRNFLEDSLAGMAKNMQSRIRARLLKPLATISSGYDSSTVAALGRSAGVQDAITIRRSNRGGNDSGHAIADSLGLNCNEADQNCWRSLKNAEAMFLASDGKGSNVYIAAFHQMLPGSVLLTGFHGDILWDCNNAKLSSSLARKGAGGLSMTEYRLIAGYVHAPVPFLGARSAASIHAISMSDEMTEWHTHNHEYCRPMCRRILKDADVKTELYPTRKRVASAPLWQVGHFLNAAAAMDFQNWLEEHRDAWPQGHKRKIFVRGGAAITAKIRSGIVTATHATLGDGSRLFPRFFQRFKHDKRHNFLFPWAVRHLRRYYRINRDQVL